MEQTQRDPSLFVMSGKWWYYQDLQCTVNPWERWARENGQEIEFGQAGVSWGEWVELRNLRVREYYQSQGSKVSVEILDVFVHSPPAGSEPECYNPSANTFWILTSSSFSGDIPNWTTWMDERSWVEGSGRNFTIHEDELVEVSGWRLRTGDWWRMDLRDECRNSPWENWADETGYKYRARLTARANGETSDPLGRAAQEDMIWEYYASLGITLQEVYVEVLDNTYLKDTYWKGCPTSFWIHAPKWFYGRPDGWVPSGEPQRAS